MSNFWMALIKDGVAYEAGTVTDLVQKAASIELDYGKYTMTINGVLDSITYNTDQYRPEEFRQEASRRALQVLIKQGWRLFKEIK